MRIVVYGLWHLGCVTASCLAAVGHRVVGLDPDGQVAADLQHGQPPLDEPGLADLIASGLASRQLSFTDQAVEALHEAEVLWVTFDTPVNERDEADVAHVRAQLEAIADAIPSGVLVLISSQVPVGFTRALERDWQGRELRFAYAPENLRLGKALQAFQQPERVIVGLRDLSDRPTVLTLFAPFCQRIEWMTIESAEMTKHALNAYLATSVAFANELARLCEVLGADAKEIERGLKSEPRIGPRAYLAPGAAFAGGTLARDLHYLVGFGQCRQVATPLFHGVLASNQIHRNWLHDKVRLFLGGIPQPVVAMLGLAYKPGTSTLRRSAAVEQCVWLHQQGIRVQAHDSGIRELPEELRPAMVLCDRAEEALAGADLAIVATEWPAYRSLRAEQLVQAMRRPQVIDQNHYLADVLAGDFRIAYVALGKAAA
jgi:UDPglucose 6-dehydrogenase